MFPGSYFPGSYFAGSYFSGSGTLPPVVPKAACWTLRYDGGDKRWFLSALEGNLVYTIKRFRCYGRNRFDVLLRNWTGGDVPPYVDVIPGGNPDCQCVNNTPLV
jgi:hypothetical protein